MSNNSLIKIGGGHMSYKNRGIRILELMPWFLIVTGILGTINAVFFEGRYMPTYIIALIVGVVVKFMNNSE